MDNTITTSNNLDKKIAFNRKLLDDISREFNDVFIFTGGTSLMERGIINRFSEDIDIITIESRKKFEEFLKGKGYEIKTKPSSSVNSYVIIQHSPAIETRLDIVKCKNMYGHDKLECLHNGYKEDLEHLTEPLFCKQIEQILYDKICAIIEGIPNLQENGDKLKIREIRHYYDIYKIVTTYSINFHNNIIYSSGLEEEIKRRLEKSNYKTFQTNLPKLGLLIDFYTNRNLFERNFIALKDQIFDGEELPEYSEIVSVLDNIYDYIGGFLQKNSALI